ncbi:large ribosomal subunit protein mL66-like [Liolophura sinensis]|uniref:large ribosomal subunit protein mL66-like n=1 Tax=Liolophura sinensis TaxID=3198878 RepID=UPI0031595BD3
MALQNFYKSRTLTLTWNLLKCQLCTINHKVPVCLRAFPSAAKFSTSSSKSLREIQETHDGNTITVEGKYVKSDRTGRLLHLEHQIPGTCPLCDIKVEYTDVLILSQFVGPDGNLLPAHVTGLCRKKEYQMRRMIHQAYSAGLLPKPHGGEHGEDDVLPQHKWKQYNVYFKPFKRYQLM